MNSTSSDDDRHIMNIPLVHSVFVLAYVSVFLSAVIGNILIMVVFVSQRKAQSVPNFFLANLTIADLLTALFCVIQNGTQFVISEHGNWPFGRFLCYSYIYTLHLIPNVSAGILVLVSVERLIAVLYPFRVRRIFSYRSGIISCAIVWIGSCLFNLPYYYASQYKEYHEETEIHATCTRSHILREVFGVRFNVLRFITTTNFIVWYAIPLLTLVIIYVTIGIVIKRTSDMTSLLSQQTSERSNGAISIERRRRRVCRLSFGIVFCFAICSLPRYMYLIWSVWRDPITPRCLQCIQSLLQPISFLLLFLNSALNPILYAFLSAKFRAYIKDTFGFLRKKRCLNDFEMVQTPRRGITVDESLDEY